MPFRAPVAGLYFIEKSNKIVKDPIGSLEAFESIVGQTISPVEDEELRKNISMSLLTLVDQIDCWRLHFSRNSDVSDIV